MNRWVIPNVIAYVVTLVVNFLSQSGPVGGTELFPYTVQELANSRAVLFFPANYVFSIWGIIYTALGAYVIYQALAANRASQVHPAVGPWFVVSSAANSLWLVLFLNDWQAASTVAMLVLLASLVIIYQRLEIGRAAVTTGERWAVHFAFSVYLGWISVATVANIATALVQAGFVTSLLGFGAELWTVAMMIVAAVLAGLMLWRRGDTAFAAVVVWALAGIFMRPFNTPVYADLAPQAPLLVQNAALLCAGMVLALLITRLLMGRGTPAPQEAAA
jgi:hypothetical protein